MSSGPIDEDSWRSVLAETLRGGPLSLSLPIASAALLLTLPALSIDQYWIRQLSLVAVIALTVGGFNLSFGYAGEFQLAQVFMFALGCYTTMFLAVRGWTEIVPLMLIGGFVAALLGGILVLPALRFGGLPLAIVSFFLVVAIPDLVGILKQYTGGSNGLAGIPQPRLLGHALGPTGLYVVTTATTIAWFVLYRNLVTSRYGTALRSLRQSPLLASSLGLSATRLRLLAYTWGAYPAGMAGCLFGFINLVVTPTSFDLTLAVAIIAASLLGGRESVYGAVVGAAVLQLGPQSSLSFESYAPVAYGLFLIAAAVVFGGGLSAAAKHACTRVVRLVGNTTPSRPDEPLPAPDRQPNGSQADGVSLPPVRGEPVRVRDVSKAFNGVQALSHVSLTAQPGEVAALIGSNGSGKTTLLNAICGYITTDGGDCAVGGAALGGLRPHAIARRGIARTFQTPRIPANVSTIDVVASGRFAADHRRALAAALRLPGYQRSRRTDLLQAQLILDTLGLSDVGEQHASSLPLGKQRLVEVARALCSRPQALLLDEPAAGLNPDEAARLGEVLKAVARTGAVVVVIEHNVEFVARFADVTHVLHLGAVIASGSTAAVTSDAAVVASYLGRVPAPLAPVGAATSRRRSRGAVRARAGLELAGVRSGYGDLEIVRGVSLELRPGHLEVVLGRNGAGKSTLLETISGLVLLRGGSVTLNNEELTRLPAHRRASAGIALVQQGKRVFHDRTVSENVELGAYTRTLSRPDRNRECDRVLEQFPVLLARRYEQAGTLSGGQQQLLAVAQAIAAAPWVLLLDEPSSGLAPALARDLFDLLRELADAGTGVLVVEQSAELALGVADHVTVLDGGRVASSGPPEAFHDGQALHGDYFGH